MGTIEFISNNQQEIYDYAADTNRRYITVIRNEREGNENHPIRFATEKVSEWNG